MTNAQKGRGMTSLQVTNALLLGYTQDGLTLKMMVSPKTSTTPRIALENLFKPSSIQRENVWVALLLVFGNGLIANNKMVVL